MSWIPDPPVQYSLLESLLLRALQCGPVPGHVAIIMDGNRRFARHRQLATSAGHSRGFDKLTQTLQWCNDLGVKEVTVYAFSIENFKRSKDEVDNLLEQAREKFRRLYDERDKLREHGIRVRVLGKLELLPDDLQALIAQAMEVTKENKKRTLNVAFSYTSREEIARAVRLTASGVEKGLLQPEDITEELLEQCLYTSGSGQTSSSHVDLLIRTSGEVRLSDFMLWQSAYSVLSFQPVLWPEFTFWHLAVGVFNYQRQRKTIENIRKGTDGTVSGKTTPSEKSAQRVASFVAWLAEREGA